MLFDTDGVGAHHGCPFLNIKWLVSYDKSIFICPVSKEKINEKIKLVVCEGEREDNRWFHSYSNPLRPTLPSHCPANLIFVFFTTYWICGVLVGIFLYWDGILGVFSIWGGLF